MLVKLRARTVDGEGGGPAMTTQPETVGRWTTELDELLASNAAKASREQLTLIRIFEELSGLAEKCTDTVVLASHPHTD